MSVFVLIGVFSFVEGSDMNRHSHTIINVDSVLINLIYLLTLFMCKRHHRNEHMQLKISIWKLVYH